MRACHPATAMLRTESFGFEVSTPHLPAFTEGAAIMVRVDRVRNRRLGEGPEHLHIRWHLFRTCSCKERLLRALMSAIRDGAVPACKPPYVQAKFGNDQYRIRRAILASLSSHSAWLR